MDIMQFIYENAELLTKLLVSWIPTIYLIVILLTGTLVGMRRGARKSTILLIHAVAIFTLCITLFMLLVSVKEVDAILLNIINTVLGSNTGLQDMLGVTVKCETLKEVLLEFAFIFAESTGDYGIIFKENGMYILTLIDLVYRIVFGLVLYILYFILIFLMYIIYCIFYPVSRYKKKQNRKYQNGKAEFPYRKKKLTGAIIGFSRSLVNGIVALSFLGTLLFIVSGGDGSNKYEDYDFGDDNVNLIYDVFTSVGEYGNEGIFKVLNTVKDQNETPYYLFAADIIFQGGLTDLENNIDKNVYFREELATFIGFARNTFNLLVKYDNNQIVSELISGTYEGDIMDEALVIMSNPHFQAEFTKLINDFDSETYFINLGLSFVNSFVSNIDLLLPEVKDTQAGDILKILFTKGYLCEKIPYEKQLKEEMLTAPSADSSKYVLAHLTANKLIRKSDITNIVDAIFSVIKMVGDKDIEAITEDLDFTITLVRSIIPYIKNLSILSTERENEINPVLTRLYSYIEYNVLTVDEDMVQYDLARNTKLYTKSNNMNSISWIKEINSLLDIVDDGLVIFQNLELDLNEEIDPFQLISDVFSEQHPYYTMNMRLLDDIIYEIGSSQLLGEVLSSKLVYGLIQDSLAGSVEINLPEDIAFTNKFDSNGNIVQYGEVYNLLCAIRSLAVNPKVFDIINNLDQFEEDPFASISEIIECLYDSKYNDKPSLDYLADSTFIRCLLTSFLTSDMMGEENFIYLPDEALEQGYLLQGYKVLSKEELKFFLDLVPELLTIVEDVMGDFEEDPIKIVTELVKSDVIEKLLSSKIVEGTLSNLIISQFSQYLVIPNKFMLVSTDEQDSELKKLIKIINDDIIDLNNFSMDNPYDLLKEINYETIKTILESDLLYYNLTYIMSGELLEGFVIVIPNEYKIKLVDDSLDYIIDKDALSSFINNIFTIIPTDDIELDPNTILSKVINNMDEFKKDKILLATLAHYISSNDIFGEDTIIITKRLKEEGSKEYLEKYFNSSLWKTELVSLFDALEELLSISTDPDFSFDDSDNIINKLVEQFNSLNDKCEVVDTDMTKLELCYQSEILIGTISHYLDMVFSDLVSDEKVLEACKQPGTEIYTFNNLQALVDTVSIFDFEIGENPDTSNIEDKIMNELSTFNQPNPDNRDGLSNLDILYESTIIVDILSKYINELLVDSGLIEEYDADNYLKDRYGLYNKSEINSLIELLNIFEIDSKTLEGDDMFDNIIDNITKINEDDNLDKLYTGNVFGILLTNLLEDSITLPKETLDGIENNTSIINRKLKKEEVRYLVDSFELLDIDLNNLNITEIKLDSEIIGKIYKSKIISSLLYTTIKDTEYIIIPTITLSNTLDYIVEDEFKAMLECLSEKMDLFFEKSKTNSEKYDITTVKEIDINDVNTDMIRTFTKSSILQATMVSILVDNTTDVINIPTKYQNAARRDELERNKNNIWFTSKEIEKIADALDALGLSNLSVEKDSILNVFNYDNMNSYFNNTSNTKLETIMNSNILASTLSKTIIDALGDNLIENNVLRHKDIFNSTTEIYTIAEINALLYGIDKILNINNIEQIEATEVYNTIRYDINKIDDLWKSRLLAGIVSYQIKDKAGDVIMHHDNAYETGINIYRSREVKSLFNILGSIDINDVGFDDISLDSIKDAVREVDGEVNSYLLLRTLSHKLLNTSKVVIPADTIDPNSGKNKYLYSKDIIELIEALEVLEITTLNVSFDSIGTNRSTEVYTKAFESDIIRASITGMIQINSDSNINGFVGVDYDETIVKVTKNANNKEICILSSDELLSIINALNILTDNSNSFEWKFNLDKIISMYNQGKLSEILDSNLLNVVISQNVLEVYNMVENKLTQNPMYSLFVPSLPYIEIINITLVDITNPNNIRENYELMTKDGILSFVNYLSLYWSIISQL